MLKGGFFALLALVDYGILKEVRDSRKLLAILEQHSESQSQPTSAFTTVGILSACADTYVLSSDMSLYSYQGFGQSACMMDESQVEAVHD